MVRSSLVREGEAGSITSVMVQIPGVQEGQVSGVVGVHWRMGLGSNPDIFIGPEIPTCIFFLLP